MTDNATELILIRHGHAHCNADEIIAGPGCTGLTARGRTQAEALGRRLIAEGGVSAVLASTTLRAAQTADILAGTLGLTAQPRHDLRVPDPGAAEGLQWSQARRRWSADPANPARPCPPDAEPWPEFLARVGQALAVVLDQPPTGRVVVVGHAETITAAYSILLGVTDLGRLKLAVGHTGRCLLRPAQERPGVAVPRPRWTLVTHNDLAHLPADLLIPPAVTAGS